MTIERNVISMSRNASPNTNAKMSGSLLSRLVLKSSDDAASPVTLTRAAPAARRHARDVDAPPLDLAHGRGHDVVPQLVERVEGCLVVTAPDGRDVDLGNRVVLALDELGAVLEELRVAVDRGDQRGYSG